MPAMARTLSHVYPADARLTDAGHLEIGGCDVLELAQEYGTPAYVYAENDLRAVDLGRCARDQNSPHP